MEIAEDLKKLSLKGFFLAPKETIDHFLLRKDFFLKAPHLSTEDFSSITKSLYDFEFETIPLLVSKKSLFPWQGAVLWEYISLEGIKFPLIQVHEKPLFSSLYSKEEIVAHELVHMARFSFKEPLFEEIFAYQTSPSFFRRFFGPLFLYPIEVSLFLLIWVLSYLFFGIFSSLLCFLIPSTLTLFFFCRLLFLQSCFKRCKNRLKKIGTHPAHCLPLMIRLSDLEILKISFQSSQKTKEYFNQGRKKDLRLQIISELYLTFLIESC